MCSIYHLFHLVLATIFLSSFGVKAYAVLPDKRSRDAAPRYAESMRIGDRWVAGGLQLSSSPDDLISTPSTHTKQRRETRDYVSEEEIADLRQPHAAPTEDPEEVLVMHVAVVDLQEEIVVPVSATHDGTLFLGSATITTVVPTTITTYGTLDEDGNLYFATPTLEEKLTAQTARPTDMELASGYREQTVEVPDGYFTYENVIYGFEPYDAQFYFPEDDSYSIEINANQAVHVSQSQTINGHGSEENQNTDKIDHEQPNDGDPAVNGNFGRCQQ